MASMAELFADDSSEEESVGHVGDENTIDKPVTNDNMDTTPVEEEKEEAGKTPEPAAATDETAAAAGKRQILDDDDDDSEGKADDDEGDVEFDDAEAGIVGTSAPQVKKTRDAESATADGTTAKKQTADSKPRFMHVLETKRPLEGVSLHMTKLPGMLVGIQPEAYDEDTYSAAMEEQEFNNVLHMMRWRYKRNSSGELERDEQNKLVRESNSRIVQWDDGSYTLHVGSEVFEVDSLSTSSPMGFAGINGYLYQSQKAFYSAEGDDAKEKRTPGGTVLECMGPITSKLTARPSSLQSEAHRSLTVAVRQRNMKKARIAEYVTEQDPEKLKAERIKLKEELEKDLARKNKARGSNSRRSTPGMTRRYMEEEEDDGRYDSVNIGALKRRRREEEAFDYGDDSDEDLDEEDEWATQKLSERKRKRQQGSKPVEDEEDDDDDDDGIVLGNDSSSDDEEVIINRSKVASASKKRSNQAVLEDEDDE